jgi:hypothetical protein
MLGMTACTSLGPHPQMTVAASELKATKQVERLLVMPTLGTGGVDPAVDLNRAVAAGAYERYGDLIIQAASLAHTLDTLEMPKDVAPILGASWEAAFYQWVQQSGKGEKPVKRDLNLPVPPAGKRIGKTSKDLEKLAKALRKRKDDLAPVGKAAVTADGAAIAAAVGKSAQAMKAVDTLLQHIVGRLSVTYVLVSDLEGDKDAFNSDEPITLRVALVNAMTGRFRYYAKSVGHKKDLPATYENLVAIMAHNLFEDVADVDKINR